MKLSLLALALLLAQIPKNNANGIWESASGARYEIRQNGQNLQVKLVQGSSPKYMQYEVTLKNQDEINTYKGSGNFVAKMEGGKECKFETQWTLVVVSAERILGDSTNIVADKNTCEIKEKNQGQLDLKKKK
jgi:hypothetical protein